MIVPKIIGYVKDRAIIRQFLIRRYSITADERPLLCLLVSRIISLVRFYSCTLGHSNLITCLTSFFWEKNPVRLQKKEKKSHLWCLTDESGFEIFCQTPKKKKKKCKF